MIHSKNNIIRKNTITGYCKVDPWRVGMEYGVKPYSAIYIGDSEQIEISDNIIKNPGPYAKEKIIIGKYANSKSN